MGPLHHLRHYALVKGYLPGGDGVLRSGSVFIHVLPVCSDVFARKCTVAMLVTVK